MSETISFKKQKDFIGVKLENKPRTAVLKYCLHDQLPPAEEKGVAIYTIDSHELYHGNGQGAPLSRITNDRIVTKELVYVMYDLQVGVVEPEIMFPYYGKIKNVQLLPSSNQPISQRLIIDLEINRSGVWSQLRRLYMNVGDVILNDSDLDIPINGEVLRFRVYDIQDNLNNLVATIQINV